MDGTLLNTLEDLCAATNYALREFNYPQKSLEEVRLAVGNGVAKLIERVIPGGIENPDFHRVWNVSAVIIQSICRIGQRRIPELLRCFSG